MSDRQNDSEGAGYYDGAADSVQNSGMEETSSSSEVFSEMKESGGIQNSFAVLSDAIRLKQTCNPTELWDHKHKQKDYQELIRYVLTKAGIKNPNVSESGRAMESAHDIDYTSDDEGCSVRQRKTNSTFSREVGREAFVRMGRGENFREKKAERKKNIVHMMSRHGNGINLPYEDASYHLSNDGDLLNDSMLGQVKGKHVLKGENEYARIYNNRFTYIPSESDIDSMLQDDRRSRKYVLQKNMSQDESMSTRKSSKRSKEKMRESDCETRVNYGKFRKSFKGDGGDFDGTKSIRNSKKQFIERPSESDADAPVQMVNKSRKSVKGNSVGLRMSKCIQNLNKGYIESMSESDDQVPLRSLEKIKKAVKGKTVVSGGSHSIKKSNKRYIASQTESDAEAPLQKIENSTITLTRKHKDIGELSKRVKGKNVVQKDSKSIVMLNKRFQVSESESDSETPVRYIGMSTRNSNKRFLEIHSESDREANNVSCLNKGVNRKCLGRAEDKTSWKLNNLFLESRSESYGKAAELNGNSTEPIMSNVMVHGENKTIKKLKKRFLDSHSEGDEEHPVKDRAKSGIPAKEKRVVSNMKSDKCCPENNSEAGEENQQILRSLKGLKKICDGE